MRDLYGIGGLHLVQRLFLAVGIGSAAMLGFSLASGIFQLPWMAVVCGSALVLQAAIASRAFEAMSGAFLRLDIDIYLRTEPIFLRHAGFWTSVGLGALGAALALAHQVWGAPPLPIAGGVLAAGWSLPLWVSLKIVRRMQGEARRNQHVMNQLQSACENAPNRAALARVEATLACFRAEGQRNPWPGGVRGVGLVDLPSRAWYEAKDFPFVADLEAHGDTLVREFEALRDSADLGFSEYAYGNVGRDWDALELFEADGTTPTEAARRHCPTTVELLRAFPGHYTRHRQYSRMGPRGLIGPHRDDGNLVLNCHVGVEIPDGVCEIRVGHEVRSWELGRAIVFDPSFEHEVWNRTDAFRTVLQVSFFNPALTPDEMEFMEQHFFGKAASA